MTDSGQMLVVNASVCLQLYLGPLYAYRKLKEEQR